MGLQSADEERQFGREDLLSAWLEWKRWANAHVDLSTYSEARVRALSAAFGVDLDEVEEEPGRDAWARRWHYGLFRTTARDYNRFLNFGWCQPWVPSRFVALGQFVTAG